MTDFRSNLVSIHQKHLTLAFSFFIEVVKARPMNR